MSDYVGWTFMSTGPEPKFKEIGRSFAFIARRFNQGCHEGAFLFVGRWFSRYRPGGHECPPYGASYELF